MQSRDFCYWLQGFFEIAGTNSTLTKAQCKTIQAHLAMVFAHEIDPSHGTPEHRAELQDIHDNAKRVDELRDYFEHPCTHDIKLMC
jgi:hypothetical protein